MISRFHNTFFFRSDSWLRVLIVLLGFLYLVNTLTPLRLHVDSIRYLQIKDCIEFGCAKDSTAAMDYLPYGYTALLILLSKLNILSSFTLVFINCAYLFGSLFFINSIFRGNLYTSLFLILVLFNWTIIKFVAHPLSEMQFMFFSTACLYYFNRYTKSRNLFFLLTAVFFSLIAFFTRTVGIVLIASLIASFFWLHRVPIVLYIFRRKIIIVAIIGVTILAMFLMNRFGLNHYLTEFNKQFGEGVRYSEILRWHFVELAELFLNSSVDKIKSIFPSPWISILFLIVGILFLFTFIKVLLLKRKGIPPIVLIYISLYGLLIFNWPYYDPRFWVPVLPLLLGVILIDLDYETVFLKIKKNYIIFPLLLVYLVMGLISSVYFTYTSLNKNVLARTQANGVYKKEYEIFFNDQHEYSIYQVDTTVVNLLRRYN
jgi:hypothetical protein